MNFEQLFMESMSKKPIQKFLNIRCAKIQNQTSAIVFSRNKILEKNSKVWKWNELNEELTCYLHIDVDEQEPFNSTKNRYVEITVLRGDL
jgi:hypothetical protein